MKAPLILTVLALIASPALPQSENGIIEGRVTRYGTQEPIANVEISLTPDGAAAANFMFEAVTDDQGHFKLNEVHPGKYAIRARRRGFVNPAPKGVRLEDGGSIRLIRIEPGQHVRNAEMTLSPGGVIAGRVLDQNGKPLAAVRMMAFPFPTQAGRPFMLVETDDRGEYRLFDLEGGRYVLLATAASNFVRYSQFGDTYFGNTTDIALARILDVTESSVLSGNDIVLQPVDALFKVSGQLTSLNFNLAGKQITEVYLVRDPLPPAGMFPTDSNGGMFSMGFQNESRTVDETRLEFAFSEVRPGSYHMYVETGNRVNRQDCCDVVGVADLRVGGEDVNGLRVRASVVDVSGRVEVLGNPSAKPSTSFNLAIVPDDIQTRLVKSDVAGAFTIPAVMNGKWKLQTSGLAKGYAVFDVMQGDASVYESGFQIEDKPPQSLRVLLSPAGTIDGVVRDAQQKPVPAANVLLIPSAPNPMASALYRSASSDAAGRFSFAAVPEGDFSVFAFDGSGLNEEIPKTSAAIQEFIVRDASRGTKARVTAGTVISVDLERLSRTP